jgi:hypothetical protein
MSKTIIVGSLEFEVSDWKEASPIPPAGVAPEVQDEQDEALRRRGVVILRFGEASFTCEIPLAVGTGFILKEDGRNFVVTFVRHKMHVALEKLV